ncbi:hypothetical protein FHT76_008089 [Rhizobium sp. BK176]|nr:hypothetical protein [Rhizobium sp. BK661]MCS4096368.1 hypothetical protein [Rhizobium sp. BK176]
MTGGEIWAGLPPSMSSWTSYSISILPDLNPDGSRSGFEDFMELFYKRRPFIVFSVHIGNFELLAVVGAAFGLNLTALCRPQTIPTSPQNSPDFQAKGWATSCRRPWDHLSHLRGIGAWRRRRLAGWPEISQGPFDHVLWARRADNPVARQVGTAVQFVSLLCPLLRPPGNRISARTRGSCPAEWCRSAVAKPLVSAFSIAP